MPTYPENVEDLGAPGPHLSTMRVQHCEEHGFMPGDELTGQLLDNDWETNPPHQEGEDPFFAKIDPILLKQHYQHQQQQGDVAEMSAAGHRKLIQRRPDLAPFLDGGAHAAPQSGYDHGNVPDQIALPVAPNQPTERSSDFAAAVPNVGDAAPVANYGIASDGVAAPVPDSGVHAMIQLPVPAQDDPFVPSSSASSATSAQAAPAPAAASAPQQTAPIPAVASAPQQAPPRGPRNAWTEPEKARVYYLKFHLGWKWPAIKKDLGRHTLGSIRDKFYEIRREVRLREG